MKVDGHEIKEGLYYNDEHEWVDLKDDEALIGISDFAQDELGDIVYVELPDISDGCETENVLSELESVKAVSEVYCPINGEVIEVNESLVDAPEMINESPYDSWIAKVKVQDKSDVNNLMDHEEYAEFVQE